ncbi:MAG: hypothetical protein JRE40_00300 [Deltaproteobacteria bacterium]|nr:hypothetical protein [Deltaproteobacteria bacterium]
MTIPQSENPISNAELMKWLADQDISIITQVSSQNTERVQFKHNHRSLKTGKTNVRPKETMLADLFIDFQEAYKKHGYNEALKFFIPIKVALSL